MATLYELTGDILRLYQMAEEETLDPEIYADTLEALHGELEDKADACAKVIRNIEGDIAMRDVEIARMTARNKSDKQNIKNMKQALEMAMRASGKVKFKTALFSFGIQKNPPSLVIDDEKQIPTKYLIPQDPKVDNAGIKKMLKGLPEGEICTFAHLEQTEGLRIK